MAIAVIRKGKNTLTNLLLAILMFAASTAITWWFIVQGSESYESKNKMILSCTIAGMKWALQIGAAYFLLTQYSRFLRDVAAVCLVASLILLPYSVMGGPESYFFGSLIVSVIVMIPLYYYAVYRSRLPVRWFISWLICLAAAVFCQLVFVFHIVSL